MTRTVQQFGNVTNGNPIGSGGSTGTTGPVWAATVGVGGSVTGTTVSGEYLTAGAGIKIVAGGSSAATFLSTGLSGTARGRWCILGPVANPVLASGTDLVVARSRATAGSPTVAFSITHRNDGYFKISSGTADINIGGTGGKSPNPISFAGGAPTWLAFDVEVDIANNKIKGAFIDPITGAFALGMTAYVELTGASVGSTAFSNVAVGKVASEPLTAAYTLFFDSTNDEDSYTPAAPAGGNAYVVVINDTIGITDTGLNQSQVITTTIDDTIGLTDTAGSVGGVKVISDPVGITDVVTAVMTSVPIPPPTNLSPDYSFLFGRCTVATFGAVALDMIDLPKVQAGITAQNTPIGGSSRSTDGTLRQDRFGLKREWPSLQLAPQLDLASWWPVLRMWKAGGPWLFYDHTVANLLNADQRLLRSWTNPAGAALPLRGDAATTVAPGNTAQMGPGTNPSRDWLVPVTAGNLYFAGCTVRGAGGWNCTVKIAWYNEAGPTPLSTSTLGTFTSTTALQDVKVLDGSVTGSRVGGSAVAPAGALYAQIIVSPTVAYCDISDPNFVPGPDDPGNAMFVVQLNDMPETHAIVTRASMSLNMSEM